MTLRTEDLNLTDWDFQERPIEEQHAAFAAPYARPGLARRGDSSERW